MKKTFFWAIGLVLLFGVGNAFGDVTYTFTPSPADLGDLSHQSAYYWSINSNLQKVDGLTMWNRIDGINNSGRTEYISSASLTFKSIYNWNNLSNTLFVNLFDDKINSTAYTIGGSTAGYIKTYSDNTADTELSDYFDNNASFPSASNPHIDLIDKSFSSSAQTYTYYFTSSNPDEIAKLMEYAYNDKYFALALDPDCHYSNDGISLSVTFSGSTTTQQAVPEPATMMLFGTGLVGLAGVARKRLKK